MPLELKQFKELPKELEPYFTLAKGTYQFNINLGNALELFYGVALYEFVRHPAVEPRISTANIYKTIKKLNLNYSSAKQKINKIKTVTHYDNDGIKDVLTTNLDGEFMPNSIEPILGSITFSSGANRSIRRIILEAFAKIDEKVKGKEDAVDYYNKKIKEFVSISRNLVTVFNNRNDGIISEIFEKRKSLLEDNKKDNITFDLELSGTNIDEGNNRQQKADFIVKYKATWNEGGSNEHEEKTYKISIKYGTSNATIWNTGESKLIDVATEEFGFTQRPSSYASLGDKMERWFSAASRSEKEKKNSLIKLYEKMQFDNDPILSVVQLGKSGKLISFTNDITKIFGKQAIILFVDQLSNFINIKYKFEDKILSQFFRKVFATGGDKDTWNRFYYFEKRLKGDIIVNTGLIVSSQISLRKFEDLKIAIKTWELKPENRRKQIHKLTVNDITKLTVKGRKLKIKA